MPASKPQALHPRDFAVNQTWLAFRINQLPVKAGDSELDIFILQDAASMFIFGNAFAPHGAAGPSDADAEALLHKAWSRRQEWPGELVLPGRPSNDNPFVRAAKHNSVPIRRVPESQMSFYITDAQKSFEEFLSRGA